MTERRWPFSVIDARKRRRAGSIVFTDSTSVVPAPRERDQFLIVLLARPASIRQTPGNTAVCIPATPLETAIGTTQSGRPSFTREHVAAYASGRIAMAAEGMIAARDVFGGGGGRPKLALLARVIVDAALAEERAPYLAVIRHELHLRPGADAVAALAARLSPPDRHARPPATAPAVRRLKSVLRALRAGDVPGEDIGQLSDDVRFLRMFGDDAPPLSGTALSRLFADVMAPVTGKPARPRVVPMRRRRDG